MNEMNALGILLMIGTGVFMFLFTLISIVFYVLGALWEMKFLQKVGYDKPWFAWIPFCNFIAMGDVAFSDDVQEVEADIIHKSFPTWVFKFFTVLLVGINVVLGWIPILSSLISIVDILVYIAFYGPIIRTIAKKFNIEITAGRCFLDSFITLLSFYDVYTWSNKYQYSPYVNSSDVTDSQRFDCSGVEQNSQTVSDDNSVD